MATAAAASDQLLYTAEQVAHLLSLSRATIYRLMDRGEIRTVTIGTARRVPRKVLDLYVESLTE